MVLSRPKLWRLMLLLLCCALPLGQHADAASPVLNLTGPLAKPAGRVILTITGDIERANSDNGAEFDRDMLEAIGMVELRTATRFSGGLTAFRGVRMQDLLRYVGARGETVEASALDLYQVEIPMSDFDNENVILALEADGRKLRVRDRGPAWIMYPFTSDPSLDNEVIHSRCVWQLVSLNVR